MLGFVSVSLLQRISGKKIDILPCFHLVWGVGPVVFYDCMYWICDYAMYTICRLIYMHCCWTDRFQIRVVSACHKGTGGFSQD